MLIWLVLVEETGGWGHHLELLLLHDVLVVELVIDDRIPLFHIMWTVYVVSFFCICYQSLQEVMDSCEVLTHRLLASRMFSLGTLRDASQEWQSWCLLQLHLRLVLLFLTWRFLPSTIGLLDGEEVTHLWLICAFHLCFCPCSRVRFLRQKADIWRFEHIWEYFDFVVVTILSVYLMEIHLSFFAFEHAQFFSCQ